MPAELGPCGSIQMKLPPGPARRDQPCLAKPAGNGCAARAPPACRCSLAEAHGTCRRDLNTEQGFGCLEALGAGGEGPGLFKGLGEPAPTLRTGTGRGRRACGPGPGRWDTVRPQGPGSMAGAGVAPQDACSVPHGSARGPGQAGWGGAVTAPAPPGMTAPWGCRATGSCPGTGPCSLRAREHPGPGAGERALAAAQLRLGAGGSGPSPEKGQESRSPVPRRAPAPVLSRGSACTEPGPPGLHLPGAAAMFRTPGSEHTFLPVPAGLVAKQRKQSAGHATPVMRAN